MCVCVSMSGCMCVNVSKEHGKKQKRMSHVCLDIFCANISEEYGIFDLQILSRTKFSLLDIKTLPFTLLSMCMGWTSCTHTPAPPLHSLLGFTNAPMHSIICMDFK